MQPEQALVNRLKRGPALLLLGQDYLRLGLGADPFLSEVVRKFGVPGLHADTYSRLFDTTASRDSEAALAWMHALSRRLSAPPSLNTIAAFPWNAVYTTAIDDLWIPAFRLSWRDLQYIPDDRYIPSDPRNRLLLHVTMLFGSVSRTEASEVAPLSRLAWLKRRQIATALARRIPELLTPLGTLVIEGYDPARDWFSIEDFLPLADSLRLDQVQWFSVAPTLASAPDLDMLVESGKVVIHEHTLATFLLRAEESGTIRLGSPPDEVAGGRRVYIQHNAVPVPTEVWNQASRSALVLDSAAVSPPPPLSPDAEYQAFRNFLSTAEGKPQWAAYGRNLAFARAFEADLHRRVAQGLEAKRLSDTPLLLHGPTATGKTVALARLAYETAKRGRYPALFIERKTRRPAPSDIDRFCQWVEDAGAPATLVVWDGMVRPEEYGDFLRHLSSRGRKVVLVGSCYRLDHSDAQEYASIEAAAELTDAEISAFTTFLVRFHPDLKHVAVLAVSLGHVFLEGLYRMLPSTRTAIRDGVCREVGAAEAELLKRAGEIHAAIPSGPLAAALYKAGLLTTTVLDLESQQDIGGEAVKAAQQLTGLVMVPGQFGLKVPLELLMRSLGQLGTVDIAKLFAKVDIFRWFEDEVANYDVGPRNALEARLLVQARLGKAEPEIAYSKKLLLEVHERETFTEDREVNFAVDLLRAIGPQSGKYFSRFFKELSDTLKDLRITRGTRNPRLMLQEANLLREWAVDQANQGAQHDIVDNALVEVEQILRDALEDAEQQHRSAALRVYLLTELATALGSRARQNRWNAKLARTVFDSAREALLRARRIDPRNYYPVDVLAWATRDMVDYGVLTGLARTEAIVDLLHAFQTSDPSEFDREQQERFHTRRLELGDLIKDPQLSDDAFQQLEQQGSAAGYYLRARRLAGLPDSAAHLTEGNLNRLRAALGYLEGNRPKINQDGRCLDLLLDLWWMANAKQRFFEVERQGLPFSQPDWSYLLQLVTSIELTGQSHRSLLLRFLAALALFHIGDLEQCVQAFKEIESEAEQVLGRRRVVRSYVASDATGRPVKFHGTVAWISLDRNRAEVSVDELRRKIGFLPNDFPHVEARRGATLGTFHIAFNFLGPIADPVGRA